MERIHRAAGNGTHSFPAVRQLYTARRAFPFSEFSSHCSFITAGVVAGGNDGIAKRGNTVDSGIKTRSYILFLTNKTIPGSATQNPPNAMS